MGGKQNATTSHSTVDLLQFARYLKRYPLSILEDLAQTHQSVKHSIRNLVLSTLCYTISIFILVSTRTAP
jgi:hypothetical protein